MNKLIKKEQTEVDLISPNKDSSMYRFISPCGTCIYSPPFGYCITGLEK